MLYIGVNDSIMTRPILSVASQIITAKTVSNFEECIEYAKSNGMNVINYFSDFTNNDVKECNPVKCDGEDAKSLMMDTWMANEVYTCQVTTT